ncbi:hypothetical protein AU152_gp57 [Mycobacterium phage Phlei]|uniref:Uncharacterized protein n=1 Tax=Mycobacterium phage Phlei TaxID=1690684 RepID=A0A0N9BDR9_9CAUD|nr:hypothetical protein AU152_gp57 [Mycobacterium phage Phlei]ALA48170.1 hypothetical protein [Mycobacterium phage Phlei]
MAEVNLEEALYETFNDFILSDLTVEDINKAVEKIMNVIGQAYGPPF